MYSRYSNRLVGDLCSLVRVVPTGLSTAVACGLILIVYGRAIDVRHPRPPRLGAGGAARSSESPVTAQLTLRHATTPSTPHTRLFHMLIFQNDLCPNDSHNVPLRHAINPWARRRDARPRMPSGYAAQKQNSRPMSRPSLQSLSGVTIPTHTHTPMSPPIGCIYARPKCKCACARACAYACARASTRGFNAYHNSICRDIQPHVCIVNRRVYITDRRPLSKIRGTSR